MDSEALPAFFQTLQKACLPGVWSKGVAWARDKRVQLDSRTAEEIVLRVRVPDRPVAAKVSLWPADEDYFCDCDDRADPCPHVAAAISALKNGLEAPSGAASPGEAASSQGPAPGISYRFNRAGKALRFERFIGEARLSESLVSVVGGIQSGRITEFQKLAPTQDDFAVDRALGSARGNALDRTTSVRLLSALRGSNAVTLDGLAVQAAPSIRGIHAEVRDDGPGFRLVGVEDQTITEVFENGIVLCGSLLRILEDPGLTREERQLLQPPGKWFSPQEAPVLVSEIIPGLERKLQVRIVSRKLPQVSPELASAPPRIVLELETLAGERLGVIPKLQYASPYSAKAPEMERQLARKLQSELQLGLGQRTEFQGLAAVEFVKRAGAWELSGVGAQAFAIEPGLVADFAAGARDFSLGFKTASGKSADPSAVFRAWREGEAYVPLLGGGYAPLPQDWLARFGPRIEKLLLAQEEIAGKLASHFLPELAFLSDELHARTDASLRALRSRLESFDSIPQAKLPSGLKAELRHYQRQGVNWLCFLRDSGMGALLADDMGLGKTLQALCAIQGRTLVVSPTSVLYAWKEQIERFRPDLRVSLYSGASRKLDPQADITLTSYGILRLDREALVAQGWQTAILDEAQTIKNPESKVAQAAHRIQAQFRVTLSGTPVENSMEDLWSQFQFLNPGLLGSRSEFQDEFASPIARGDAAAAARLRAKIKPFLLRRLKRDVAPELPPRTEVVLQCELSDPERELYDALLASSRKEVLEKLEQGGSVFGALEMLLRLRQACCHPSLVPGQKSPSSSKLELLAESLESSVAQGHRALVFSQWTSFLDLIEPKLKAMNLAFLRLDGSTSDRQKVVQEFQDPEGPRVMLISLKAGGTGLTLTAADHVFLMDSWWNPAVEDQAADRAHRIGQENPVLVFRMISHGTVEERILELQKRKQALSGAVLEGAAGVSSLTREDLLSLFD